jgi:hypothetical protein
MKMGIFERFAPHEIVRPGVFVTAYLFGVGFFLDAGLDEKWFLALGALILGLYLGNAWRGAHERWQAEINFYWRDGKWISDKARNMKLNRWKLLGYQALLALFTLTLIALAFYWQAFLFSKAFSPELRGFGPWIVVPTLTILVMLGMAPFLIYVDSLKKGEWFAARMNRELKKYESLDSERKTVLLYKEQEELQRELGRIVLMPDNTHKPPPDDTPS